MFELSPEILMARRSWSTSQAAFAGNVARRLDGPVEIGWYDQHVHPEAGAFALVRPQGEHAALAGEILKVTVGVKPIFVYVFGSEVEIPTDLALYRRAFMEFEVPTVGTINAVVEVVEDALA